MRRAQVGVEVEKRARIAAVGAKAFRRIAKLWDLTVDQQLALLGDSVSRSTLLTWDKDPPRDLNVDQRMRLSFVVAIYEGLQRLYRQHPATADAWVKRPSADAPFFGRSPLDFMLQENIPGLRETRAYLDSLAGGPPSREASLVWGGR